jgi:hypothetical protein
MSSASRGKVENEWPNLVDPLLESAPVNRKEIGLPTCELVSCESGTRFREGVEQVMQRIGEIPWDTAVGVQPLELLGGEGRDPGEFRYHQLLGLRVIREDPIGPLVVLSATTGMRQGEALALRWDDVDLDAATLTVRATLDPHTREAAPTKTGPRGGPSSCRERL